MSTSDENLICPQPHSHSKLLTNFRKEIANIKEKNNFQLNTQIKMVLIIEETLERKEK